MKEGRKKERKEGRKVSKSRMGGLRARYKSNLN